MRYQNNLSNDSSSRSPLSEADTCATSIGNTIILGKAKRRAIKAKIEVLNHFTKFTNSEGEKK